MKFHDRVYPQLRLFHIPALHHTQYHTSTSLCYKFIFLQLPFFHLIVHQVSHSPFSRELFLEIRQLPDQRVAGVCEGLLWRVVVVGLDSQHKVGKQRMLDLVGCENDSGVVQQL